MSISAKKCVSLSLYLLGCFGLESLVVLIENNAQLCPKKNPFSGTLISKKPVLDRFSDICSETSVYVQILELFLKNFK